MSKNIKIQSFNTAEIAALPRNNYRNEEEFIHEDLIALGERIKDDGQITPVGVAVFPDGSKMLCYGERRVRACELAGVTTINVTEFKVADMKQFKQLQASENLDRNNTDPISDGKLFAEMVANGISIVDITRKIQFPNGINTREKQVAFIKDRIALSKCHPTVHAAFRLGVLKTFTSGETQASLFVTFPLETQEKVADHLIKAGKATTNDGITQLFKEYSWYHTATNVPFPSEWLTPEVTAILDGRSVIVDKEWFDAKIEEWKAQQTKKAQELADEIGGKVYILRSTDSYVWGGENDPENSIRGYVKSEKGKSSHTQVGIICEGRFGSEINSSFYHVIYFCPTSSKCPIHFPQKEAERLEAKEERIEKANSQEAMKLFAKAAKDAVADTHWTKLPEIKLPLPEMVRSYIISTFYGTPIEKVAETLGLSKDRFKFSKDDYLNAFHNLAESQGLDTYEMCAKLVGIAKWWSMAEFAVHHKDDFAQMGITFDELEKVAENNIKTRLDKFEEEKARIETKNAEMQACVIAAISKGVDFMDEQSVLAFLVKDEEMKKLCRKLSVNIKGLTDPGDRLLVARKVVTRYNELCQLGIVKDERIKATRWLEDDKVDTDPEGWGGFDLYEFRMTSEGMASHDDEFETEDDRLERLEEDVPTDDELEEELESAEDIY